MPALTLQNLRQTRRGAQLPIKRLLLARQPHRLVKHISDYRRVIRALLEEQFAFDPQDFRYDPAVIHLRRPAQGLVDLDQTFRDVASRGQNRGELRLKRGMNRQVYPDSEKICLGGLGIGPEPGFSHAS